MAAPDPQEIAALDDAEAALLRFMPGMAQARSIASVAISAWIISRTRQAAGIRLTDNVVFDLENAHLAGLIEAALPALGAALSDLPADAPFFELPKEDVVRVFVAGVLAAREAGVSLFESQSFPFDDTIPFGDAA